ncbi:hypothetical protein [Legionella hackeliae]|uniref:Uncharacterized protein n=1 Tax=Legionella hackeliae TaxID=449 RepID=A0A0A8UUW7_LEGHA|nr:hypothetical protein [Legionella hackeliae]KTD15322.1 hypothetical protein Lhac_0164 [Legionella hackeliae]CEK11311.1 protein of unknown function [Legionella hackeliae]STX48081.1 Uncharacterised protein [Legionella hackeliae]
MTDNIFLLVEEYLVKPDTLRLNNIRQVCRDLQNDAFNKATSDKLLELAQKIKSIPTDNDSKEYRKAIKGLIGEELVAHANITDLEDLTNSQYGMRIVEHLGQLASMRLTDLTKEKHAFIVKINTMAREDVPKELDKILEQQAEVACTLSTRVVTNPGIQTPDQSVSKKSWPFDDKFIVRVRKEQANQLQTLIDTLVGEAGITKLMPLALTTISGKYIFREGKSKFQYCDNAEEVIHRHTTLLGLKIKELTARGESTVAGVLERAHQNIIAICAETNLATKPLTQNQLKRISDTLTEARNSPELKTHRGAKQIIINFLLVLSGIGLFALAATAGKRDSFWYRPGTDSENTVEDFEQSINKSSKSSA